MIYLKTNNRYRVCPPIPCHDSHCLADLSWFWIAPLPNHVWLLPPCGLWPARLLCPWEFSGKNTGVGSHFFLQGILLTQRSNPHLLHVLHWEADSSSLSHLGSPTLTSVVTLNYLTVFTNSKTVLDQPGFSAVKYCQLFQHLTIRLPVSIHFYSWRHWQSNSVQIPFHWFCMLWELMKSEILSIVIVLVPIHKNGFCLIQELS